MKAFEAGKAMYQEMRDRPKRIEENIARIEAHPHFLRQCEVLEAVQAAFAEEKDDAVKKDMWVRFYSFFHIDAPHSNTLENIESIIASAAYHGTFTREKLANMLAQGDRGTLGNAVLESWNHIDRVSTEDEWFGNALSADFSTEAHEDTADSTDNSKSIMELHLMSSNISGIRQYFSVIKEDLKTLRAMLRQSNAHKVDTVRMESWVISPRLRTTLGTLFSANMLDRMKQLEPEYDKIMGSDDVEDGIDYDKIGSIIGQAASNNPKVARDWIVDKKPPDIGYIECSLSDFLQEPT